MRDKDFDDFFGNNSGGEDDFDSFDFDSELSGEEDYLKEEEFLDGNLNTEEKKAFNKTTIYIIISGIILIMLALLIANLLHGFGREKKSESFEDRYVEIGKESRKEKDIVGISIENRNIEVIRLDSEWVEFKKDDKIEIQDKMVRTTFTVTDVTHMAKKVSHTEEDLMIKSVVRGNLSGFVGTFELELPYHKGSKLSKGLNFDVDVYVGTYGDRDVVDGIIY